jgi:hypothetical protein
MNKLGIMPAGWIKRWPTLEEIAEHDRHIGGATGSGPGHWLARCTEPGLSGDLLSGFFDEERQFTVCLPSLERDGEVDTCTTTVAPGWMFCPVDEWGRVTRQLPEGGPYAH